MDRSKWEAGQINLVDSHKEHGEQKAKVLRYGGMYRVSCDLDSSQPIGGVGGSYRTRGVGLVVTRGSGRGEGA